MLGTLLEAAVGGVVEAAAGKGIVGAARLGAKVKDSTLGEPVAIQGAVETVVETAIRKVRSAYFAKEGAQADDVLRWFDHPPFAHDIVRVLIFRGAPDLDRLHAAYVEQARERGAASERWQRLEAPLIALYEEIEQRLLNDPVAGPPLRAGRQLAALERITETDLALLSTARELSRYAQRNVAAVEQHGSLLQAILAHVGRLDATVAELPDLLRGLSEGRPDDSQDDGVPDGLTPAERVYLRSLRDRCNQIPLAEEQREDHRRGTANPSLDHVFVDLDTDASPSIDLILDRAGVPDSDRDSARKRLEKWTIDVAVNRDLRQAVAERGEHPLAPWLEDHDEQRRAMARLSATEALASGARLVLLGDPGSGKSTVVNHISYRLAGHQLRVGEEGPGLPEVLTEAFPIRIEMRKWYRALLDDPESLTVEDHELVYRGLESLNRDVGRERWLVRLEDPRTLVLFDGLDEVPETAEGHGPSRPRAWLVESVRAFCAAHDRCRVLVTCRVRPYRDAALRIAELPVYTLAALDEPKVATFCTRWYEELEHIGRLSAEKAGERHARLREALARQVLAEMAGSPLLLTMLAHINVGKRLPEDRAELYEACTEQLLWEWERPKVEDVKAKSLDALLEEAGGKVGRIDVERVLWQLTYEGYGAGEEGGDLAVSTVRDRLALRHSDRHEGQAWASRVVSLIGERAGLLLNLDDAQLGFPHKSFREYFAARWLALDDEIAAKSADLAKADDRWHEVIELACGHLRREGRRGTVRDVVRRLAALPLPRRGTGWENVLLTGLVWRDLGGCQSDDRPLHRKVARRLHRAMTKAELAAPQRAEAGFILSDAGVLPEDLDALVHIADEADLGYDFQIGKYPVTNAQYHRFVAGGGYDPGRPWWSDQAKEAIGRWREEWPRGPGRASSRPFNRPIQPVVGVSWYEAMAYCAWLTQALRDEGTIEHDAIVRLPTEDEWALTAAGVDGRTYPWGGEPDPTRLNHADSGVGRPTPVDMYPRGVSPEGVFDLCGNVWEWLVSEDESKSTRPLAGGGWYMDLETLTSAARGRGAPGGGLDDCGFRVVVVPVPRAPFSIPSF